MPLLPSGGNLAASDADTGTAPPVWINPGNVTASDNVYAEVTLTAAGQKSAELIVSFDYSSIPCDAVILGIEVDVEWSVVNALTDASGDTIRLHDGKTGEALSENRITGSEAGPEFVETTDTFGGPSDLWGTSLIRGYMLTAKDVQVRLVVVQAQASPTVRVDFVSCRIFFYVPCRYRLRQLRRNPCGYAV